MNRIAKISLLVVMLLSTLIVCAGCGGNVEESSSDFAYVTNETGEYITIVRYKGENAEVVIPDTLNGKPVQEIGEYTFYSTPHVTAITIPSSVKKIGDPSFCTLPNLQTIHVSDESISFTVVDGVLFHKKMGTVYCYPQGKAGDTYTLPNTVKTINGKAFYSTQLKEVVIDDNVTKILASSFENCKALEKVVLSKKVSQIFERAFANCENLKAIDFPDSVTSIGAECFRGCTSLQSVLVKSNTGVIERGAFADCTSLEEVVVESSALQRVAEETFKGDSSLKSISFSTNLMGIADQAFMNCSALQSFAVPETLVSLGTEAFSGCCALNDIVLPDSLVNIGANALNGVALPNANMDGFVITQNGVLLAYTGPSTEVVLPDGLVSVSYVSPNLTKVTIPEGVTSLADGAFRNCTALQQVVLPSTLKTIGKNCFANCAALVNFEVPVNLESIGAGSFADCSSMESFTVAKGNISFYTDSGVLYDKIRRTLVCYPMNSSMTSYSMPFGPSAIADGAVRGAKNLESFDASVAENVVTFPDYAFADCPKLKSVKVTNSFSSLGAHTFENCGALTDFEMKYTITGIGESCFSGCSSIAEMRLENPIAKIGVNAFSGMNCKFKVDAGSFAEQYALSFDLDYTK